MRWISDRVLFLVTIVSLLSLALSTACGSSGGGGSSSSGPAYARITSNPEKIDTGDRTEVRVVLRNIEEDSITIKIRYPIALDYILDSSYYSVNGRILDAGPEEDRSDSTYSYLVYYVTTDYLDSDSGVLVFTLEGRDNVQEGTIGVDIDFDNPDLDNSGEFDLETPKFDPQSEADIQVGPDPEPTSTPSSS